MSTMTQFTAQRWDQIISSMLDAHEIHPYDLHCSITGTFLGELSSEQVSLLWDSLDPNDSDETIIHELWTRTILASRPSPAWNYLKPETINRLRVTNPIQLCAYFLGRYYTPRDKQYSPLTRTIDQRINDGINRIKSAQMLSTLQADSPEFDRFLGILLLIDTHFSLNKVTLPIAQSPFDLDFDSLEALNNKLEAAYASLISLRAKTEREGKYTSNSYGTGNRSTQKAAVNHLIETKPKSEAALKREHTKQQVAEMASLLFAMMNPSMTTRHKLDLLETPANIPPPIRYGFKLGKTPQS